MIFGTILKIETVRTKTNDEEDKKVDYDVQGLRSER